MNTQKGTGKNFMKIVRAAMAAALLAIVSASVLAQEIIQIEMDPLPLPSNGSGVEGIAAPGPIVFVEDYYPGPAAPLSVQTGSPVEVIEASPPDVRVGFNGVVAESSSSLPPDTHIAVGPGLGTQGRVVMVTNHNFQIWDKLGNVIAGPTWIRDVVPFQLAAPFDPKVLYDQHSGRFFIVTLEAQNSVESRIHIAVSNSGVPNNLTTDWTMFSALAGVTFGNKDTWSDYPSIGTDADSLFITVNLFPDGGGFFAGVKIRVFDKAQLIAGTQSFNDIDIDFDVIPLGTAQPAHVYGSTDSGGFYLISRLTPDFYRMLHITGAPAAPVMTQAVRQWTAGAFPINTNAEQQGSSVRLDTLSTRAMNAVYRDGHIWVCMTADPDGDTRTEVVWQDIATNGGPTNTSITQWGFINGTGTNPWTYMPSINVNDAGAVAIGYTQSSLTEFPGVYYITRDSTEPSDPFTTPTVALLGPGFYDSRFEGDSSRDERWGDYSATVVDPTDDCFWIANEFSIESAVGASAWGTYIANFCTTETALQSLICDLLVVGEASTTFINDAATTLGATVTTTNDFDNTPLDSFDVIIFTDDSAGLFSTDTLTTQRLADFVSDGGGVLVEVGGDEAKLDYGWVPHEGITASPVAPENADQVTIVEPSHEIVDGVSDSDPDLWGQSIHGDFLTTGGLTTILANTNTGNAVMLAGEIGKGRVIYTTVDATADGHVGSASGQLNLLAGEIQFLCGVCEPAASRDNPSPADGEQNVELEPILMWELDAITSGEAVSASNGIEPLLTGDCEDSFDVYFGTNPSILPLVSEGTTETFYDPGPLEPGITYFWQVDGENCCGLSTGALWQFTTQNFCTTFTLPTIGGIVPGDQVTVPISAEIDPDKDLFGITDLFIEYDPTVLSIPAGDTSRVSTGGLLSGFFMIVNVDTPGEIRIAASATEAVVGSGTAFEITFDAVGERGDSTVLDMTNVRVEDSMLEQFCGVLIDGMVYLQNEFYVDGSMRYFGASNAPVDQTSLIIEVTYEFGATTLFDQNDGNGNYALTLGGGFNYQVIPIRLTQSGDQIAITAGDASLLLQHLVGLTTLSDNQKLAGDTNCDGVLTAGDAGQILQLLVGKINLPFPGCAYGWRFVPSSRFYNPLSGDHTNQDYKGILIGDVSGNWSPPSP